MTKVKSVQEVPKEGLRHLKNGLVHKTKQLKFKNKPTGKVTVINSIQQKGNVKMERQNIENSLKQTKLPIHANKTSSGLKILKHSKKSAQIKVNVNEEQDDSNSSDNDINEGISIQEEVSASEDEADNSTCSNDVAIPNIFGTSLAEETDEDDDEFDANSDGDKGEATANKGIKMFKGLKVKAEPAEFSSDDENQEKEEEENNESDDEENTSTTAAATDEGGCSDDDDDSSRNHTAHLDTGIADGFDDDDYEGHEDDKDKRMSDGDEDYTRCPSKKDKVVKTDDAEEDTEGEDENNGNYNSMNVKSDEDKAKKPPKVSQEEKVERDKRTIFIGNVPKETEISRIKSEFKEFGAIDSIRMRGVIPESPKMSLKVAAITRKFHPKSTTICVFVTYKNVESVEKALSMNGKKLDGNYLRVDHAKQSSRQIKDKKRTVFLGNLPFEIEDNEIWEAFMGCGQIESVRIIRDRNTGVGRGFGYINFTSTDGAVLAMDMNGTTIKNRELRVKVNTLKERKKLRMERGHKRQLAEKAETDSLKKLKIEVLESIEVAKHNSVNAERRTERRKRSQGEKQKGKSGGPTNPQEKEAEKFQGQKADAKKKFKLDKSTKKKKQIAIKLLAKPKRPVTN